MAEALPLSSVIGFGGAVFNGLILHPDGQTMIYPLGSTVVLRDKKDARAQEFLQGHSDKVSCLALSKSGRYLATGQSTYMGFTADIIIWDLETRSLMHRMALHKVKVQALDFSYDEQLLVSLGGQDDNTMVLWDVQTARALCGSTAHSQPATTVKFFNNRSDKLITAGNYNLRIWQHDVVTCKLLPQDAILGQLKREFRTVTIDQADQYAYCGSSTGDVLQVSLDTALFKNLGPGKEGLHLGATASFEIPTGDVVVGSGDGTLVVMGTASEPLPGGHSKGLKKLPRLAQLKLEGAVTSIVYSEAHHLQEARQGVLKFYVGTSACNVYKVTYEPRSNRFVEELFLTAHSERVNGLAFPHELGEVFATCGVGYIRVWHLATCRELLRISVPNLEAHCVIFSTDGKSIISGWSDGKIRAFGPQSGKLLYSINDAHQKAVTALVCSSDSARLVSGGGEGLVRIWRIGKQSQSLEASMKDHRGQVNCLRIKANNDECVSASSDGSCIIWDLRTFKRRTSLFANTCFKSVVYHPDESQLVTTGTDRKITYWDAYDGQAIRIIDASDKDEVDALAVDVEGEAIVSGGGDKLVRLFGYDEGHCYFIGMAHSGAVTQVGVTPDKTKIVTVGAEGGIFVWDYISPSSGGGR